VGAAAAVGGGAALAAGGGGGSSSSSSSGSGSGLRTTSFPNEALRVGAGRDFVVTVNGAGTLTARVSWVQAGLQLGMYIVALSNTPQVLGEGNQSGSNEMMLSIPVTAQVYRISVTHSSGLGAQVDATITLTVQHP
jgi:large repetitive protein